MWTFHFKMSSQELAAAPLKLELTELEERLVKQAKLSLS